MSTGGADEETASTGRDARHAPGHRLFVDTADVAALERWLPTGILHGVTTNPTILARARLGSDVDTVARLAAFAFEHGAAEFQAQTWGGTAEDYARTGRRLADVDPRMVVKVPMTEAGLRAARALVGHGVRVTMTAIHDAAQVLVAAALGADYAAPYHGRIADADRDADRAIGEMLAITGAGPDAGANAGTGTGGGGHAGTGKGHPPRRTRVLVASVRSARVAATLAARGCDTLTLSPAVLEAMVVRPDSEAATAVFEAEAANGAGAR